MITRSILAAGQPQNRIQWSEHRQSDPAQTIGPSERQSSHTDRFKRECMHVSSMAQGRAPFYTCLPR